MSRIRSFSGLLALTALLLLSGCSSSPIATGVDASVANAPPVAPSSAGSSAGSSIGSSVGNPPSVARVVVVAGRERTFRVVAPVTVEPGQRLPVLIMLHGAGGNAASFAELTGMSLLAERWGFVVVYPDGTQAAGIRGELAWNAGGCCGVPARNETDDVAVIRQVITDVDAAYPIDQARVFVAGFSNGGMLSYRLACELGDRITGIADVAGAFNVATCDRASATKVLIIHGTADTTVPYTGGATSPQIAVRFGTWSNASVPEAVTAWVQSNACDPRPTVTTQGVVTTQRFERCATNAAVELVSIDRGTHRWPTQARDGWAASERIVQFFGLDQ